jgi:hypothetical protein
MATTEQIQMPALGEHGEPCSNCGAPLAADQRYCLECGTRRAAPRIPFDSQLHSANGANGAQPPATAGAAREPSPLGAVLGIAALGVMLLIGVLIGRGNNDSSSAPPAITVAGGTGAGATAAGGPASNASSTQFSDDWPSGKNGWTVEIGTLPKQGTTPAQVNAAKQDATSKGASDVGALVSDNYASLPAGDYVIYSGVFDSQSAANSALSKLKSDFPDAKVVEVSDQAAPGSSSSSSPSASSGSGDALTSGANAGSSAEGPVQASTADLQALDNATGSDYKPQNIPDQVVTPGAPPKPDNQAPGAGDTGQTFK